MQDAEPIARARLKAQLFASRGQAQMQHHMRLHGRDQICGPPLGALVDNRQDSRVDLDAQAREQIFSNMNQSERNHDYAQTGIALIIDLDRIEGWAGMNPDGQVGKVRMLRDAG